MHQNNGENKAGPENVLCLAAKSGERSRWIESRVLGNPAWTYTWSVARSVLVYWCARNATVWWCNFGCINTIAWSCEWGLLLQDSCKFGCQYLRLHLQNETLTPFIAGVLILQLSTWVMKAINENFPGALRTLHLAPFNFKTEDVSSSPGVHFATKTNAPVYCKHSYTEPILQLLISLPIGVRIQLNR